MKETKQLAILTAIIAVIFLASLPFIISDAVHGRGSFMSTAAYRWEVQEVHK